MPTHQDFFRKIEETPEDDMPRLVYADWLEEQGDADRAKLIRLQREAAKIQATFRRLGELSAKERAHMKKLEAEADKLVEANSEAWTKGLPKWAKDAQFHRGFLRFVFISGKQLVDDGATLRALSPVGGWMSLRLLKGREQAVFESEHLSMVTRLGLKQSQLTDEAMKLLVASKHLKRVYNLDLRVRETIT